MRVVYLFLAAGILAISASAIIIRIAQLEGVPSIVIAAGRLILAATVITPIVLLRYRNNVRKLNRRDFLVAILAGVFLALHFATWITSLEYTSVLVSTVLVTTSPLWVVILEVFVLRARLPRLFVIGLLLAVAGGIYIAVSSAPQSTTGENNQSELGAFLALAGSFTFACYIIIGRRIRSKLPILPYIWLVYGFGGITLLIWVFITNVPITGYSATGYLMIVASALIPQLIGHTSLNYALAYVPATFVSLVTQLEPIGSAILAFIILQELPPPQQIIGSAIILLGVIVAGFAQQRESRALRATRK